ncbi:hypothetical protein OFB47_32435, partial [Escherichia coli]|nr:hypothetical protein [Escherichia coli]
SRAFADYEVRIDKRQLQDMLVRRGFEPALSYGAFEAGQIIAFTLNGIEEKDGTCTAYDTGTGTIKEFRGRGLAAKIFQYSIPF